jgi:hypothetical protein
MIDGYGVAIMCLGFSASVGERLNLAVPSTVRAAGSPALSPPGAYPGSMSDDSGDDRLLTIVGVGLVAAVVIALGVVAVAFAAGPSDQGVDADLRLERVNDTHAKIVHGGGEPVESENLVVTVDSYERPVAMPSVLVEGDEVTFELRDDQGARLVYDLGRNEREIVSRLRPGVF